MGKLSIVPRTRLASTSLWIAVLLISFLAPPANSQTQATAQPLNLPSAIAYDSEGNLYIAETGENIVRKVDTAGTITTVAGTGTQGFAGDGGIAISARLDSPQGLALDQSNHLYIADTHNHRVRSVDLSTGIITTAAGTIAGFSGDNGPATSARLDCPTALDVDADGNLYIADSRNNRVRKVLASTGVIVTVAGNGTQGYSGDNGPAVAASIDSPTGLAIDAAGDLYLADTHNHRVRKETAATGTITTITGDGTLTLPRGLALDRAGDLYIADAGNNRVRRIDATTGTVTTMAGNGTQTFSGDGSPAAQAALDSPRGVAVTPSNLLTVADSANERVRQLDTEPGSSIYTIAGLAPSLPGTLKLISSPAMIYGGGEITASLIAATTASGKVTFTFLAPFASVASDSLSANAASFNTQTLGAGAYTVIASYAGDSTHPSVQSSPLNFRIDPRPLIATPSSLTLLYGQTVPTLSGSIAGILPQDSGSLSANFATTATNASPAGIYPISVSITGAAAKNYAVNATTASLTIKPAPTVTTLTASTDSVTSGTPITVSAHVISTTTGIPAGTITLVDGRTPIATLPAAADSASFSVGQLAPGLHPLTVSYAGNGNFLASVSTPAVITIIPAPSNSADFALISTGALSQTVTSSGTASFNFAIQNEGADLASPIKLAATGLPTLATASFNPGYIPPGAASGTFVLTVNMPQKSADSHSIVGTGIAFALLLPGIFFWPKRRRAMIAAILSAGFFLLSGCGSRVYKGTGESGGSIKTYEITVTGTATSPTGTVVQHSTMVKLIVPSAS